MQRFFAGIASRSAYLMGHPLAFLISVLACLVWAGTGPLFHYSDTWADPEHQTPPAAWADMNLAQMAGALHDYTRANIAALKAAGTPVDMAVIGNETTFGMLWPKGRVPFTVPTGNATTDASHKGITGVGGFDGYATFLKAGILGARSADPTVNSPTCSEKAWRHW